MLELPKGCPLLTAREGDGDGDCSSRSDQSDFDVVSSRVSKIVAHPEIEAVFSGIAWLDYRQGEPR